MRNFYQKKSGVRAAAAAMLTVLACNAANAQDYTENNINYYINDDEAYVGESYNATGVSTVRQTAEKADGLYYNLSGQRTGKPARGLYIRNGKKFVIK